MKQPAMYKTTSLMDSMASRTLPTRPSQLRQMNARGLLKLLQEHSPCSKADLVRHSGLSAPTVSSGVAHLESLGLVEQMGDGESNGGRPPGLLRFHARHGYVAAVDIGGTRLRMMLADLSGTVIEQSSILLGAKQKTPGAVCSLIVEGLKTMCRHSGTPLRKVMHLTAAAPGITNVTTGIVVSAPNLVAWNDVPLRDLLERSLKMPCRVENDTNLAAVGEFWRGVARDINDFVFLALGTGVGAGIFVNGRLYRGSQWSAGEIGYFGVSGMKRLPMNVREPGQLERAIGGFGIEEEWRRVLQRNAGPALGRTAKATLKGLRASQIFDLAAKGDRAAGEVLRFASGILADTITEISLLLNPEMMVLGGGVGSHPVLCHATEALMRDHEFAQPLLRSSSLGTQAQLYGAVSVSLNAVEEQILD